MNEKITIIMPCYRAEAYVGDVVKDVLRQTYPDWELIAVSNGPEQEAQLAILHALAASDARGRVKVVSVERGNVSNARNVGMEEMTGEWLTFVDADDRLGEDHLQRYIDAAREAGGMADLLCGGITECWVKENREGTRLLPALPPGVAGKRALLLEEPIMVNSIWNKLFRTSFVRASGVRFKERFTQSQDAVFVRELLLQTSQVGLFALSGYRYMHHRVQTNSMSRYHACFEEVVREKRRLLDELLSQVGMSDEEIAAHRRAGLWVSTYQCFCNLFRARCPLTFGERCEAVQRIVFADAERLQVLRSEPREGHNRAQRVFDTFCRVGSAWWMTASYWCASKVCYGLWPLFSRLYPMLHK